MSIRLAERTLDVAASTPSGSAISDRTDELRERSSFGTSIAGGRLPPGLQAGAPAWIWVGVLTGVAGFVLITIGWAQVAGELEVYRQLPYLVSAGLFGLGLIMIGVTVLSVTVRQRDGIDRDDRIDELVRILEELKEILAMSRDRQR